MRARFTRLLSPLASRPILQIAILGTAILALLLSGAAFFPVGAGPDEPAHYVYASAVVRGQAGTLEPTVPARIDNLHRFAACLAFQPDITAACQGPLRLGSTGDVLSQTNAGYYNPVFYAWTGIGTLIIPTEYGLYLSRALAAVVTAFFLAWALSFIWRRSVTQWPLVAAALVLTPMTLFVGMVLNPSAWEITTLLAVTAAAYHVFAQSGSSTGWREEHSLLLVAGALLIVTRGLSPLFLAITGVALIVAFRREPILRALRARSSWIIILVFIVVAAASVIWVAKHGTHYVGVVPPATLWDGVQGISFFYSNFQDQLTQMYGSLGWLDLRSPQVLTSTWVLLLGGFILISFAVADLRHRLGIVTLFAAATLLPGTLAGLQWSGSGWQGRYTLPLVAALLALCGWAVDRTLADSGSKDESMRRIVVLFRVLIPAFFALGAVIIAVRAVHRYSVGDAAPWLAAPSWEPPAPLPLLGLGFLIGIAAITSLLAARPRGYVRGSE